MTTRSVPAHVPQELVHDWAFDTAPGIDRNPVGAMDALRAGPDIIYAPAGRRGRGTWVLKKYDFILEAFLATDIFSSDRYSGFSQLLGETWPMLPLEVDPPAHMPYRVLMNKVFSPKRMSELEDGILETIDRLIDDVLPRGGCEFQEAVGRPVPTSVFLRHLGLPLEDAALFLKWEHALLHGANLDERAMGARAIKDYLLATLKDRATSPRDDVVSYVAAAKIDGRPLDDLEQLGICFTLYGAGLDTVASALGFTFKYLAENQERQAELRAEPELRVKALEEFLRANAMVVPGRTVTRDINFHGVEMKRGDYVSLPTMFANRDPAQFVNATSIDFRRTDIIRHVGFGHGPHTCLGAHLARRELKIVLERWLDRVPPFRMKPGAQAVTYGGSVFGVDHLPLEW